MGDAKEQAKAHVLPTREIGAMPWYVKASADEGLLKDCILVACMDGEEMVSVSLHVATKPAKG